MDLTPEREARLIGLTTLTGIIVFLAVILVITWVQGDPTNHLHERQPPPLPANAGQPFRLG
jgi:hypothetical protein